jgi:hypothetical protein
LDTLYLTRMIYDYYFETEQERWLWMSHKEAEVIYLKKKRIHHWVGSKGRVGRQIIRSLNDLEMTTAVVQLLCKSNVRETLKYYWSTLEQLYTPFYCNTMKHDQFFYTF